MILFFSCIFSTEKRKKNAVVYKQGGNNDLLPLLQLYT